MTMELSEFLQTVPTFADFSQAELDVLERALRVDHFPKGHVLLEEGKRGRALYILMEGEIAVTRRHVISRGVDELGVLKPGEMFGLQSLVDDLPRLSTCRAKTEVTVASLPHTAFGLLYSAHLAIAEQFQYLVARQLVRELRSYDDSLRTALRLGDTSALRQDIR